MRRVWGARPARRPRGARGRARDPSWCAWLGGPSATSCFVRRASAAGPPLKAWVFRARRAVSMSTSGLLAQTGSSSTGRAGLAGNATGGTSGRGMAGFSRGSITAGSPPDTACATKTTSRVFLAPEPLVPRRKRIAIKHKHAFVNTLDWVRNLILRLQIFFSYECFVSIYFILLDIKGRLSSFRIPLCITYLCKTKDKLIYIQILHSFYRLVFYNYCLFYCIESKLSFYFLLILSYNIQYILCISSCPHLYIIAVCMQYLYILMSSVANKCTYTQTLFTLFTLYIIHYLHYIYEHNHYQQASYVQKIYKRVNLQNRCEHFVQTCICNGIRLLWMILLCYLTITGRAYFYFIIIHKLLLIIIHFNLIFSYLNEVIYLIINTVPITINIAFPFVKLFARLYMPSFLLLHQK